MTAAKPHAWVFFRAGGLDQVRVESAEDLVSLGELDLKHWVALACPVKDIEIDRRTLELIDSEHDGRIRASEVLSAVSFANSRLKDPSTIRACSDSLQISAIRDADDAGKALAAAAKRVLAGLGKAGAPAVSVNDADAALDAMAAKGRPGAGLISDASAGDPSVRAIVPEIIAAVGPDGQLGGRPAVGRAKVDAFFLAAEEHLKWWDAGESAGADGAMPLGEATFAAFDAFEAVRAKIDDYFVRCRLAGFDARAAGAAAVADADLAAVLRKTLAPENDELAALPLRPAVQGGALDLEKGLNPAWEGRIARFRQAAAAPILGPGVAELDEARWLEVKERLSPHAKWRGGKKGAAVEGLGMARLRELVSGDARKRLDAEFARDKELGNEALALDDLARLVRYNRDLHTLLRNFVNFSDFYDPNREPVFDAGRLYLDQRTCHFCVRVDDAARHMAMASASNLFLAYCECSRPGEPKITIAAAFTSGDSDYITLGRNGIFYDRRGRDWDATIVKVIENPIGLPQAFWTPYKRLARFVEDMIVKYGAAKDKAAHESATAAVAKTAETAGKAEAASPGKPADPKTFDIARFAGIFAAIGLAVGAIGGALGAMLTSFASLAWWQMPLAVAGILVVISGPSILLAWMKLRLRNLGPVLEGNGWAINGRVKINIPLGKSMTAVRRLPLNARLPHSDPFADKGARRRKILVTVFLMVAAAAGLAAWRWNDLQPLVSRLLERLGWQVF